MNASDLLRDLRATEATLDHARREPLRLLAAEAIAALDDEQAVLEAAGRTQTGNAWDRRTVEDLLAARDINYGMAGLAAIRDRAAGDAARLLARANGAA